MEYGCYTISKSDTGWTICASGSAVLDCKQKRTALTAAIRAKQLMVLDRAAMDRPNAMENTPTAAMLAAGYVRRDQYVASARKFEVGAGVWRARWL